MNSDSALYYNEFKLRHLCLIRRQLSTISVILTLGVRRSGQRTYTLIWIFLGPLTPISLHLTTDNLLVCEGLTFLSLISDLALASLVGLAGASSFLRFLGGGMS